MLLKNEMEELFGSDNLVYADPAHLNNLEIPESLKNCIVATGLPNIAGYFRFSMEFEALANDIQIGKSAEKLGQLLTIGCKGVTQLIGRYILLQEIGLSSNASLTDIGRRIEFLNMDDTVFRPEVMFAGRICFDLDSQGEIKCIKPVDLSVSFLNSGIEQLAASLIAYQKAFVMTRDFEIGLEGFQQSLTQIDPKALKGRDNVWSVIVEQLILDAEGY